MCEDNSCKASERVETHGRASLLLDEYKVKRNFGIHLMKLIVVITKKDQHFEPVFTAF